MFGSPLERRQGSSLQHTTSDAHLQALSKSFRGYFKFGDSTAYPDQWKHFWQSTVTDSYLSKKLQTPKDAKGRSLDDEDVTAIRNRLRAYLRKHKVTVGPLEPWYVPGKRPGWLPWQHDGWQVCCALLPMLDAFSDAGACLAMRQDAANAADLFVVAFVLLLASSAISITGTLFFTLCSTENGSLRRINLSGDPTLSGVEFERSKEESLTQNATKYFFLGFLPALTNPESMKLLPWRNAAAVARFGGLPSVKCVLFCTISAVLEDVSQLTVQYLYSKRTLGRLPWQLQLSMGISVVSLFFRVLLRLFIGVVELVTQGVCSKHDAPDAEEDDINLEMGQLLDDKVEEGVPTGAATPAPPPPPPPPEPEPEVEVVLDKYMSAEKQLRIGQPEESTHGVQVLMGLTDVMLGTFLQDPIGAIEREFARGGSAEDKENLRCALHGIKRAGWTSGTSLDSLVAHEHAKIAKLELHHVLALRLYTTSSYPKVNDPLRADPPQRPHPFSATTWFIDQGIKKLRAVAAQRADAHTTQVYWRGMKDLGLTMGFLQTGGTEFACLSTSASQEAAVRFAASGLPLVFKFETKDFTSRGADIAFLSVYPNEQEALYPPLTYLRSVKAEKETLGGMEMLVATVEPVFM